MKKILYTVSSIVMIFAASLTFTSCEKTFFEDVNNDPNNPYEVPPKVLLPAIQSNIAYGQGGDMARYACLFTQQVRGIARQWAVYDGYNFTESDFDNLWRFNLYGGPMMDLYTLNNICLEKGYVHYGGVAKIMMAYTLGITTDCFGDAPYSEAFQGTANTKPGYDRQEAIYTSLNTLLDEGIAALAGPDNSGLTIRTEDLMYGGDLSKWTKFAYSLKARFAMHLSKKTGNVAAANAALAASVNGFASNADDAQFNFGDGETSANPWYQFNSQRGDIAYTGYLLDTLMPSLSDPRLAVYSDGNSGLAPFYGSIGSPVMFMTYSELQFIEAEANVYLGNDGPAADALSRAITANMIKLGITDPTTISTYIATHGQISGTVQDKLNTVMNQKYISLFLHPESWTDWRRTGIPVLYPNDGAVTSEIPRRFLYPLSENNNNSAAVNAAVAAQGGATITDRVWWDN